MLGSFVRFVLPAAIWTTLIPVTLFAYVHVHVQQFIQNVSISAPVIEVFEQYTGLTYATGEEFGLSAARIYAQTALTVFLSLCALGLLLFLEPPFKWLAGWRSVSPDPRPAILALVLTVLLLVGLYIPAIANYLGLMPLHGLVWRDIGIGLVFGAWGFGCSGATAGWSVSCTLVRRQVEAGALTMQTIRLSVPCVK